MSGNANPRVTSVTITSGDPRALATFYADLLGVEVAATEFARPGEPPEAGWAQLRTGRDGGGVTLNFEWERHWQPPVWPAKADRQFASQHLDIQVDDVDAGVAAAVAAGARVAEQQFLTGVRVLFDPAGHPFCLFTD